MLSAKDKYVIDYLKNSDLNQYDNLYLLIQEAKCIKNKSHSVSMDLFQYCKSYAGNGKNIMKDSRFYDFYNDCLLERAPYYFDDYLLYVEKDKPVEKQFYLPRRKKLKILVDDLQDLEDGRITFLGISLPPRVGKSTICIFFLSWIMGKRPESNSAMSGHSGILADGFYSEILNIICSEEYRFKDVFPDAQLKYKSAEKKEITLGKAKRFATLTCRGIDGTWTGAVNISSDGYLYVDDLVRDRTESLSPERLENRYQDYLNVLVDRKNDGSKELMVGTRWNVTDPLGRIEHDKKDNPLYRFRKIPALDENDRSNFEYDYNVGFTSQYYIDMRERLDKNEWEAKYQQNPFVREGLLLPEDELNYYNGVLPEFGLERVIAICDVAWGGGDNLSMPFGYVYNDGKVFIHDWIYNPGDKDVTYPIVVGKTMQNKPNQEHFEANNGGDVYADEISRRLLNQGFKTNITSSKADNRVSKLAKIIQYAPDIKKNFYFLDEKHRPQEYKNAMNEITTFTQVGKNLHDDGIDSLAQMQKFVEGNFYSVVQIKKRPF